MLSKSAGSSPHLDFAAVPSSSAFVSDGSSGLELSSSGVPTIHKASFQFSRGLMNPILLTSPVSYAIASALLLSFVYQPFRTRLDTYKIAAESAALPSTLDTKSTFDLSCQRK